jgi:Nucleotidyl transferase of unknown function (DUF2204)
MGSDEKPVPYEQALADAAALFDELHIGYALVGGVAAMYYGRARFTEDLDFAAASGHMDARRKHPEEMQQHHFDPTCTWKLYHDSGVEIDIWKDSHSDEIVQRAIKAKLAGREINIADPHDLIAMKLRAGRLQDDYDISETIKGTPIDDAKIRTGVTAEQFERYLEIKRRTNS